jgi:CBS domain-containing protein
VKTVRELLNGKGDAIWSIEPSRSVYDALSLMAERSIGAVLVVEGRRLVGILSERDYARQVVLKGKASRETPVCDIMTTQLFTVGYEQTVDDCMAIMTDRRVRHLPVLVDGRLVGILSIGDIVKAVIAEKQSQIEQLEDYIRTAG